MAISPDRLIRFDIDGTLISARGVGQRAIARAPGLLFEDFADVDRVAAALTR